jgi:hypothetical protein
VRPRDTIDRLLPWLARALWVVVLVAGSSAIDDAVAEAGDGRAAAVQIAALVVWVGGVAAMAVPSVWSLTATRVLVPAGVPAAVLTWAAGAETPIAVAFVVATVVATVVVASAEFGRVFVQASAYGDEDRHPLRAPAPFLAVASVAWAIWVACGLGAAVAATTGPWWLAGPLGAITAIGFVLGLPRWHRLSRRWLVLVPIGLVVHDDLVLGETIMLRRPQIGRVGLAPAGTDAADLTGPAAGHAIEIRTAETVDVMVRSTERGAGPKRIHLTGCLVAPTRPGRALEAAATRRFPVGALD